jgi:predicted thioesterase
MQGTSLQPGLTGSVEIIVAEQDCARALGSGSLPVLATPRMIALMEEAACRAIAAALPAGQTSVGTKLEVEHLAATPAGLRVHAVAVLEWIDRRTLHFTVRAEDDKEPIGRGTHVRVLVDEAKFMEKAEGKK